MSVVFKLDPNPKLRSIWVDLPQSEFSDKARKVVDEGIRLLVEQIAKDIAVDLAQRITDLTAENLMLKAANEQLAKRLAELTDGLEPPRRQLELRDAAGNLLRTATEVQAP